MKQIKIAVIPGDGIGKEVIPQGIRVIDALIENSQLTIEWTVFDWSCETYLNQGYMMPADGLEQLAKFDAIYLGAVGYPGVADHVSLWGLLLPIRKGFDQYVNLRPVRLFDGVPCPLAGKKSGDIDFYVVRENVEGEYSDIGGIHCKGTENEVVVQESIFTRKGTDRIIHYAFELANRRTRKQLTSATKSNGLFHSMPYWDSRFNEISQQYPDVITEQSHIDILTAYFVSKPEHFDVVVGSNLFGDILSDLGPACTGTIAIAPSANINPTRNFPSMFEPVHGSAPDIFGLGIANPIGSIWAGAMMLDHLGYADFHDRIVNAIEQVLKSSTVLTPDMGGKATTEELTDAVINHL